MVEQDAMMQGNGWRAARWLGAAALLAVPAVAMRFTAEVRWTAFDFAFFAGMLAVLLLGYELIARNGRGAYRIAGGVALAAAFLLVWINGAVGIIGDEGNRANLMYGAVLLVVAGGAMLTRLRAAGMARTMAVASNLVGLNWGRRARSYSSAGILKWSWSHSPAEGVVWFFQWPAAGE